LTSNNKAQQKGDDKHQGSKKYLTWGHRWTLIKHNKGGVNEHQQKTLKGCKRTST
jgi:hypothetical protein